jgi:adrenodoxin-NADP+ reductase
MSGRIVTSEGTTLRNVYVSGWAATGAKGVLASTMMNAYDTARTIVDDWMGGDEDEDIPDREEVLNSDLALDLERLPEEVEEAIGKAHVMQYGDWKKVDDAEVERGGKEGKERERMKWEEARTFLTHAL